MKCEHQILETDNMPCPWPGCSAGVSSDRLTVPRQDERGRRDCHYERWCVRRQGQVLCYHWHFIGSEPV